MLLLLFDGVLVWDVVLVVLWFELWCVDVVWCCYGVLLFDVLDVLVVFFVIVLVVFVDVCVIYVSLFVLFVFEIGCIELMMVELVDVVGGDIIVIECW